MLTKMEGKHMTQETVTIIKDNKPRLTEYEVEPTLKEAQKVVGGYVELVDLEGLGCLLVDENGKMKKKPVNEQATKLYNQLFDGFIVGDAILIKPENRKEW